MNPILPVRAAMAPKSATQVRDPAAGPPTQIPAEPPPPNPSLRLEPILGVVVMEFRNGSDRVQRSVPSEPELQAYRLAQRIGLKLDESGVD
jgi:hypothetical protein